MPAGEACRVNGHSGGIAMPPAGSSPTRAYMPSTNPWGVSIGEITVRASGHQFVL